MKDLIDKQVELYRKELKRMNLKLFAFADKSANKYQS